MFLPSLQKLIAVLIIVGGTQSDNDEVDEETNKEEVQEKEKTDQSQQTTPTTPVIDTGKGLEITSTFLVKKIVFYGFYINLFGRNK